MIAVCSVGGATCRTALLCLALAPQAASAQSTVYRAVDTAGRAVYSDRPASAASKPVPRRVPPEPSAARYDEAVARAESERIAVLRSRAENLQPRKIVTYDPRASAAVGAESTHRQYPPYLAGRRWDARLPDSPAPSLERNYQYNGR